MLACRPETAEAMTTDQSATSKMSVRVVTVRGLTQSSRSLMVTLMVPCASSNVLWGPF